MSDDAQYATSSEVQDLAEQVVFGIRGRILGRFKEVALQYGYEVRGISDIVDATVNDEILAQSWIGFAGLVADGVVKLPRDMNRVRSVKAPAGATPEVTYLYTTRTATVPLSAMTMMEVVYTEELHAVAEGPCESQAALECDGSSPNPGFLRVLPESMLPGAKIQQMVQCVPCHEASVAAYVRKSHHR